MSAAQLDHLVVVAHTLEEGVAWCEATLGITPGPGGKHPLMGTHNRLFRIGTSQNPRAYFEIIAIDFEALHAIKKVGEGQDHLKNDENKPSDPLAWHRKRWFDMDDPALRDRVKRDGPQLAHWLASVPNAQAAVNTVLALGIDRGEPLKASRQTPRGLLEWQITVRTDGQRLFDGCLPTLIQWGEVHPADGMADSAVSLEGLALQHPQAPQLKAALVAAGLQHIAVATGQARISAQLRTPKGLVRLQS